MKRLGILLVLVSLGLFTVGCKPAEEPAAPETTEVQNQTEDQAAEEGTDTTTTEEGVE